MQHETIVAELARAVEALVEAGQDEAEVYEALLTMGLGGALAKRGARTLSRELYVMSLHAAKEAERLEQAPSGTVN